MSFSVLLLLVAVWVAVVSSKCTAGTDACCFDSLRKYSSKYTWASVPWLRNCLNSIPFDARAQKARSHNAHAMKNALDYFYGYKDLAFDSLNNDANPTNYSIFNITIDIEGEIDKIMNKNYTNGVDFHFDIAKIVSHLRDAHTAYRPPFSPSLLLTSTLNYASKEINGKQVFTIISPTIIVDNMSQVYFELYQEGFPLRPRHYNKAIKKVNGINANEFFVNLAYRTCPYKDKSPCVNNFLKTEDFQLHTGLPSDDDSQYPLTHLYEFEDGEVVKVHIAIIYIAQNLLSASQEDFIKFLNLDASVEQEEPIYHDLKKLIKSMEHQPRSEKKENFGRPPKLSDVFSQYKDIINDSLQLDKQFLEENKIKIPRQLCSDDKSACYVFPNDNQAVIITLKTFESLENQLFQVFGLAAALSHELGIKRVVIDVSGNGGGYVSSAHNLLRWLVPGWNKLERREACSDVDFRVSKFWDEYHETYFARPPSKQTLHRKETKVDSSGRLLLSEICKTYTRNPKDFKELCAWIESYKVPEDREELYKLMKTSELFAPHKADHVFTEHTVGHNRGGRKGQYSAMHKMECDVSVSKFDLCSQDGNKIWWEDIRIVSDGQCGSSCSIFTSKMWLYQQATFFTYGGINKKMNFASFHGGNVEQSVDFWHRTIFGSVAGALVTGNYSLVEKLKRLNLQTPGHYSFLNHEGYTLGLRGMGDNPLPREYYLLPGDVHYQLWPNTMPNQAPIVKAMYEQLAHPFPGNGDFEKYTGSCQFIFNSTKNNIASNNAAILETEYRESNPAAIFMFSTMTVLSSVLIATMFASGVLVVLQLRTLIARQSYEQLD